MAQVLKHGHRGLLTTQFGAKTKDLTSHLDAYRPLTGPGIRVKGEQCFLSMFRFNSSLKTTTLELLLTSFNQHVVTRFQKLLILMSYFFFMLLGAISSVCVHGGDG